MTKGRIFPVSAWILLAYAVLAGFASHHREVNAQTVGRAPETSPIEIVVSDRVVLADAKRFGLNLGPQAYYASQQILRNLVSRNPGFEGQEWQSVLHCARVSEAVCTDGVEWNTWPSGFLDGFTYEVLTGKAAGNQGLVTQSLKADVASHVGVQVKLSSPPRLLAAGDDIVVRGTIPGHGSFGWSARVTGGAQVSDEVHDLAPDTPGKQAMRLTALSTAQSASLTAYFDSTAGQAYLQLRGPYVLKFRARGVSPGAVVSLGLRRATIAPSPALFQRSVKLTSTWEDYSFRMEAAEAQDVSGTLSLSFQVAGAELLLDDVSLEEAEDNGTAFRSSVVSTLQRLRPGVLRWMDSGQNYGSSLANLLAPPFARHPAGFSPGSTNPSDICLGLHEFLVLAEKVSAEPWFTMPIGMTTEDATKLVEYLAGPESTPFGKLRAARGHPKTWTSTFAQIHLEFANESWNLAQHGASLSTPESYAQRANVIAVRMRASPWYDKVHLRLIADSQAVNPYRTKTLVSRLEGFDSLDVAPYTFGHFRDASSDEAVYGPMLAEPEALVSGVLRKHSELVSRAPHPMSLSVYEVNIGTVSGTVTQQDLASAIPSLGAGLSTVDEMLLMLRDLHVQPQCLFQLGGRSFPFRNEVSPKVSETSPVWPVVVDMGGPTGRVRPVFLAVALANRAILPTMLETSVKGYDPTWTQPLNANMEGAPQAAHEIQSFAFASGSRRSLLLLNLSRTKTHTTVFSGVNAPRGKIRAEVLTSEHISDGNDMAERVRTAQKLLHTGSSSMVSLPPYSMTLLTYVATGSPAHSPH